MAHTPGPWIVDDTRKAIWTEDDRLLFLSGGGSQLDHQANCRLIAAAPDLLAALKVAIRIADEAREEWDKAPDGMRAGKLLIALSGHLKDYRPDIDSIHAAISKAEGTESNQQRREP